MGAKVERGEVEAEDLDARPQVGQRAVGDRSGAVRTEGTVEPLEVRRELVGRAIAVGAEALPDAGEERAVRLVRIRAELGDGACDLRRHAPGDRQGADVAHEQLPRELARPFDRLAHGLGAGRGVPVHVPADPGAEAERRRGVGDLVAQSADDGGDGLPEGRLEEPQAGADLVDDAGTRRADRIGLPERGDLGVEPGDDALAPKRCQPRVVERAQAAGDALMGGEDGSPGRLGRVGGEHGLDVEPTCGVGELVTGHARGAEQLDGVGDRLACDGALALVVAAAADAVVLLGDVRELEEEGERGEDAILGRDVEAGDRLVELRVVAARPGAAGERADALLEGEERVALLLDEHLPEQVAEEVDVGTQRLDRGGVGHRPQFYALSVASGASDAASPTTSPTTTSAGPGRSAASGQAARRAAR